MEKRYENQLINIQEVRLLTQHAEPLSSAADLDLDSVVVRFRGALYWFKKRELMKLTDLHSKLRKLTLIDYLDPPNTSHDRYYFQNHIRQPQVAMTGF